MPVTGKLSLRPNSEGIDVEWSIKNFFSLSDTDGVCYSSPDFSFNGDKWYLGIYPNGSQFTGSSEHIDLGLGQHLISTSVYLEISFSLKTVEKEKNKKKHVKYFGDNNIYNAFHRFISRSELLRRQSELVPQDVLTVVCKIKKASSARYGICSYCKRVFDAESLSSHQKRCLRRPIKCPDCLDVVDLQKWLDKHECQKKRPGDYKCRKKVQMAVAVAIIVIAFVTGYVFAYSNCLPLPPSHSQGGAEVNRAAQSGITRSHIPEASTLSQAGAAKTYGSDLVMSNEQLQVKTAQLKAVAETLKARESELNAIKKEHEELKSTCYESIAREKNKLKHCLDSEKQNLVMSNEQLQVKTAQLKAVAETLKARESELNAIKKEHEELKSTCYESIAREKNKLKHCLDSEKQNLVMSNEQLQVKTAQLKAVAETLKARESELNAIKKEHEELKSTCYESIAREKNKLKHCLDSEKQNCVRLKKEMEEKQSKIDSITKELRKKETDLNDFKNKNEKLILKIKEIESEKKLLEEKATENENHNSSKDHGKKLVYAATIIILVISIACVYVYSKTSISVQHPYGEGTQTISAEEDNIVKADLSEVAETDEPEAYDSKTCAIETEGPITFNNPPEDCGFVTDINHLLKENRGVDITFELETPNGKTKLFAHKLILAVMSSYFADEFYDKGRNKGHQVIPLKGIDPKAFEQMIRYCYGEKLSLRSTDDSCALFKVASEFKVISLRNLCHTFFKHTKIEPGNIFSILKISVEMEDQSLQDMCYKILQEKTREVMSAYYLCDVTPAMVYTLLNLPKLSLNSEYELINWLFNWGKVKSEDKNSSCISTRDYLAKLLRNMNFLALTVKEFAMLTRDNPNFFNSDEIASVSMNIVIPGTREMPVWHNEDLKVRVYTGSNE